ncbi:hypothetical protein BGZ51_001307 [Haplosporangium sp. Z 767]|nr:hypothetical protein BGZ51_001307 [Haplosporangium sp. Z 767]KAF9196691.1 hypothetical protein BGZ50_007855 [Haplosporangium sp. Z 11]
MHKLFQGVRNHPPAHINKPLPEPLVNPDEGKTPIGELVIVPIQGRDLPNRERFGKQDPFILFKLGNVSKRSTTDLRGGQRPRWKDDQITINVYESDAKDANLLYVTCLDEDHQKNELISDCVINLSKVLEQGEHDDWFPLLYKGREAGELMLQLTYYSHDPTHRTNKMNRTPHTPVPHSGAPLRRPIYPNNGTARRPTPSPTPSPPQPSAAPATAQVPASTQDDGPIYRPPPMTEPAPIPPTIPAHPYGGRVSPSGQSPYGTHMAPNVPLNQHQQLPPGASPYATTNGYSSLQSPSPAAGVYDPNRRLSLPSQQQLYPPIGYPCHGNVNNNAMGYPPQFNTVNGYPPQQNNGMATGYPPQQGNGMATGYPPQQSNGTATGYPPQQSNGMAAGYPPQQSNGMATGYPPQQNNGMATGYPPQNFNNNNSNNTTMNNTMNGYPPVQFPSQGYPPVTGGLYPPTIPQPMTTSGPTGGIYPPVTFPLAASNGGGYPPQPTQSRPVPAPPNGNNAATAVSQSPGLSASAITTLPGSWPGSSPRTNNTYNSNTDKNNAGTFGSNPGGHKQNLSYGQPTSTYPTISMPFVSPPTAMINDLPGGYPPALPPRATVTSPPALPPRNLNQPSGQPPSYTQAMYGFGGL